MQISFNTKIYLKKKKINLFLKIIFILLGIIIGGCVFIKILVGDFKFSDISGILVSVFFMVLAYNRIPKKPLFGYGECILNFEDEKLTIIYPDINFNGKKFKETIDILYKDIEMIEYSNELNCFRIVAPYMVEKNDSKAAIANNDETFIFVPDNEKREIVLNAIQKFSCFVVKILEGEEDYCENT